MLAHDALLEAAVLGWEEFIEGVPRTPMSPPARRHCAFVGGRIDTLCKPAHDDSAARDKAL